MTKAQSTRKYILEKAFDLIYKNGYQATSVDRIIETTKVTKGAFYYHFKNKQQMGIALIKVIIFPRIKNGLISPLENNSDAIESIYQTIENFILKLTRMEMSNGCPLNNIIQEMAAINKEFQQVLSMIIHYWENMLIRTLKRAVLNQNLSADHDLENIAQFIIAGYEGARSTAKLFPSKEYFKVYLQQLKVYLYGL